MVIVYKVKEVKKVKSRKILKNDERKRSIFMNKKWKRTTVLGGLAVIVMVILRKRKKQLKYIGKFNFVAPSKLQQSKKLEQLMKN